MDASLSVAAVPLAPAAHTTPWHELLKTSDALWAGLFYVGLQLFPAEEDGQPDEVYELRNCDCGSTLARRRL